MADHGSFVEFLKNRENNLTQEQKDVIIKLVELGFNLTGANGSYPEYPDYNQNNNSIEDINALPMVKIFFYVVYILIFLIGMFGNLLVILVVMRNKSMQTVTNLFITNLALSDILLCIFAVPFTPLYLLTYRSWVSPVLVYLLEPPPPLQLSLLISFSLTLHLSTVP